MTDLPQALAIPPEAADWLGLLRRHRRWLVVSHVNPDGDTTGCAVAMGHLLRALGAEVDLVCPDPYPAHYRFLDGSQDVWVGQLPPDAGDAGVITVDFTDWGRVGPMAGLLSTRSPIVVIDHHVSNQRFGDHNLVLPAAAATGEVVYALFKHFQVPISRAAAEALYTALVTDTGCFSYGATGAHTHRIAAELIEAGVVPERVNQQIFEQVSLAEVRLKAAATEQVTLAMDGRVAWTIISREMLRRYGAREEHCDGVAERLRALAGVDTSFFLRELEDGRYKVSLRSKGAVDVNAVAANFGGGGHVRASGCTVDAPPEAAVARILDLLAPELAAAR